MAEPTPTDGNTPLTEAEQKQLEALIAKRTKAEAAANDKARRDKLASLATVEAFIKLVKTDKITSAIEAVMADQTVDFDTKQKVQSFRDSLTYNVGPLDALITELSVTPTA